MKITLEINKKYPCLVPRKLLRKAVQETLTASKYGFLNSKEAVVSIAIVSKREITSLNKQYRGKKEETDILSFANYKNKKLLERVKEKNLFLGELIICCEYVKKSAKIDAVPMKQEMVHVVSHGVLHLLGFKHSKKMFGIQNKVTKSLI